MTIKVGDSIPDSEVFVLGDGGPEGVAASKLFAGKKVAVFGVPGAFTRTCSAQHLPGFVNNAEAIKAKGVDEIICLAVNDVFVLAAWAKEHDPDGKIQMVSDGVLNFSRDTGLEFDLSKVGFGTRCQRFSMVVDDGKVTHVHLEQPGAFGETSGEILLEDL